MFSVSWTGTPYNNHVWVWVDFCPVSGVSPGTFAKAEISAVSVTSGTYTDLNGRGFFVTASGTTVTATLSNAPNPPDKFNWCAYGSDYPPNVTANGGTYTLRGTPPFALITANGATTQTVNGTTIATSAVTITPVTITDETGYPGDFCIYTGSDLYIDGTHLCQQRTSGAKNWEAYIKDGRDNQVYRITQFLDGSWWMAEDMNNADKRVAICSGYSYYRGSNKPDCPVGWQLPTDDQLTKRFTGFADTWGAALTASSTWSLYCNCCTNSGRWDGIVSDCVNTRVDQGTIWIWNWSSSSSGVGYCNNTAGNTGRVRCFRQL
jgi:signal peptidase I